MLKNDCSISGNAYLLKKKVERTIKKETVKKV